MAREEGYTEGYDSGQDRINLLNVRLSEAGRMDDIVRAALDKGYQASLFKEFDL